MTSRNRRVRPSHLLQTFPHFLCKYTLLRPEIEPLGSHTQHSQDFGLRSLWQNMKPRFPLREVTWGHFPCVSMQKGLEAGRGKKHPANVETSFPNQLMGVSHYKTTPVGAVLCKKGTRARKGQLSRPGSFTSAKLRSFQKHSCTLSKHHTQVAPLHFAKFNSQLSGLRMLFFTAVS